MVRPAGVGSVAEASLVLASASDQHEELANIRLSERTGEIGGELDHFRYLYPYQAVPPGPAAQPSVTVARDLP